MKNYIRRGGLYEAYNRKTFMKSIALQPLVAEQAFIPCMIVMYVPFQMGYSSLIYHWRLQSDRPKY